MNKEKVLPFSLLPQYLDSNYQNGLEEDIESMVLQKVRLNDLLYYDKKYYAENKNNQSKILKPIIQRFDMVPGTNSMLIKDSKDLFAHINKIYSLSQSHYSWASGVNLGGTFPVNCCNVSSKNLQYAFLDSGYTNVTRFADFFYEHAYLGFPFVFEKTNENGMIILDPTSNQLNYDGEAHLPKNYIRVVGERALAKLGGFDIYFPSYTTNFSNLEVLRKDSAMSSEMIDYYFQNVFKNPVNVSIYQNKYSK